MTDIILSAQAVKLAATLDCAPPPLSTGDPLPPGWHWCYFHEVTPLSGIGRDGHQALGEFLPPVDLPRRMWAAGDIEITQPLSLGETVEKVSTIEAVDEKQGRTGKLVFVRVSHRLTGSMAQTCARCTRSSIARHPPQMLPRHRPRCRRTRPSGHAA
jgi:3-methylfumaryl-CoA hydratase